MEIGNIIILIVLGLAAGLINIFAGGGSILVVPFLIFIGLPAPVANATNRVAILLQNIVSIATFKQKKFWIIKQIINYFYPPFWEVLQGLLLP